MYYPLRLQIILVIYKMPPKTDLATIIKPILQKNSELAELAEDQQIFDTIISILSGQGQTDNSQSLPIFLADQCGVKSNDIMFLINELINSSTTLTILGDKIIKLWLTINIYETVDAFRANPEAGIKRKNIQEVFKNYQFQGGSLEGLIQTSFNSIREPFQKDDIIGIAADFTEKKTEEMKSLFAKKEIAPMQQITQPIPVAPIQQITQPERTNVNNEIFGYNADKSAEEQLQDLIQDFKVFPEGSFQKLVQGELIVAHALKFSLTNKIQESFSFKSDFGQLKQAYVKVYGSLTSEIEELFAKIENQQNKKKFENLFTLKTKVFPINVLELRRLINKTNDAKSLIKGRDVIFVIGNTGSGKSTNILKFLGYTLRLGEFNGLTTLIPVEKLEDAHKTFYTSPEAKSCTRYINAIEVPDKMYPKGTPPIKKTLILCDSPGFGDSAGVEVDIANGVGMINALHGARSVRVVVILPYHSLVGDRMDGAVKMGEIISNLFFELTVLESIKIYFNKVPQNEIQQIPLKIQNKLDNLTQIQKSNQKLITFLKEILQSSKDSDNFLNPLQDDYKKLFSQIYKMPPIMQVKESFQYEFADSTKKQIEKFAQGEKSKTKDYFNAKKYDHAQFHLKMLEILKNILINNQKLKVLYQEMILFIQQESANKFVQYEQYITEIINCQSNASTEKKLKQYKENIIQIHHLFHQFEGIQLVTEESIKRLIGEQKKKLLGHFSDLSGLTEESITAVKTFSKILAPNLQQQASKIVDKKFSQAFQEIEAMVKDKNYAQLKDKLHNLLVLYKYTEKLSQSISLKSASQKMEKLKKMLEEEVEQGIKTITLIIHEPQRLKAKMVNDTNAKIQNIKQIESLRFLEKGQEIRQRLNSLLKQIEGTCKRTVRQLDNVRLTLNEEVQPNGNIEENQLTSKKKAIEFLMKIDCIGENLKEDYDNAIENISRKLKENVEILRNGIAALKGNKTEEIYRNLQNIKKATTIVLRCSKIIDKGEQSNQLALSIQSEFMMFLKGEIQILKEFEVKITRVPQQNYFDKIVEQCRKIETYAKMGIIGNSIKQAVESIRKQFKIKLNTPLKEFLEKQIIIIEQKKAYKFLTFSLDKLQKLCTYLFQAEDNFSTQYRSQIKESQMIIADRLKPFFQAMQGDIAKFLELQDSISEHPLFLKDLVKILLALNNKKKTCQFLNLRADFNIEDHINNIERKLKQIFDCLETSFNGHAKAAQVQAIYENCKYYSEIEQYYKETKFGFKQLQKQCSLAFTKSLQHDEDRIRVLIKDTSPTRISFSNLKNYYQQFRALKGPQGVKKRRFIVDELRIVEKSCQSDLIKFKKEMDDPDFINKDDFLKAFQEANVLVKELNELYTEEEDKKSIIIQKEDIRKIGIKIISVFQSKFAIVYNQIMEQNINNIQQNIKSFGSLQTMIYEAFPLEALMEENEQGMSKVVAKEEEKEEVKLINFVLEQINILKSMIETHPHLKEEKLNAKNTKRLKILLEYLRKGTQNDMNMKYKTVLTMQFNAGFQRYYSNCSMQQKKELIGKINQKMDMLFQQYKDKIKESGDAAQSFFMDIETYFNYLPSEISLNRRRDLKRLKQSLTNSLDKDIDDVTKVFSDNPAKSKDFFTQSKLSITKKQNGIHQKYVKKFEAIFDQSNFTVLRLQKKLQFLNLYIIKVLQDNDVYFKEDQIMLQSLNRRFSKYLKQLTKEGKENLKIIKDFMENIQTEQKETYFQQLISNIFKIYSFILCIKDDLYGDFTTMKKVEKSSVENSIMNIKQFKEQFAEDYQTQIQEIGKRFKKGTEYRPSEKINSTDILDHTKMKKVQTYIQYLKIGGSIINNIEAQVKVFQKSKINRPELKKLEKTDFCKILKEYEIQMEIMYKFCNEYQFYTEQKRNWPPKVIEEDIKSLDHNFRILTERRQFFIKDVITSDHNNYDFDGIKPKIQKRFEDLVEYSKKEIKKTYQSYYGDPATKVNLLAAQLQAMEKKQLRIIKPELVKDIHKEIKELVRLESAQICTKASRQFKELQEKIEDLNKKIKTLETDKNDSIQHENNTFDTQFTTKRKDTEEDYNARIGLQTTEDKKAQLINAMKAQINSIKKDLNYIKVKNIEQIQKKFSEQLQTYNKSISPAIEAYTQSVKIAKKSLLDLCVQAEKRTQMAQKLLVGVDKLKTKYVRMIQKRFDKDEKDERSIGKQILNSSKSFRHYQASKFSKLIVGQGIDYVTDNLERITLDGRKKMTTVELDSVRTCYAQFKKRYEHLKQNYKNNPTDTTVNYMVQPIQTLGKQIRDAFYFEKYQSVYKDSATHKLHLLAGIFALWAILKSQVFEGEVEFTVEPHPTQITTLILLLGISHSEEKLADRLAQVGTGQGKSIVLAGLSCYLALVGFKVRCACYSAYLSGRDQESFKGLFSKLNIQNQIKYGTFHQLCEDILNSGGNNLKQSVQKMLLQPPKGILQNIASAIGGSFERLNNKLKNGTNSKQEDSTILVIDEVDVFFDDSYFGKNYCPGIKLKDQTISAFLEHVWKEVSQKQKDIEPDSLIESQPFKKLAEKFSTIKQLLKNQVHGMVAGALNCNHDYVIVNQKIGYKDGDSISYKINYGYKTVFANLLEYGRGKISRQSLDESLQICLMIAEFSYAMLPVYFKNILGVTGTLEVLPRYKKEQLATRYKINDQYAIPSAFGINKRRIENYTITSKENFYQEIINKINQIQHNRPIIIFFKGPRELNEFYVHPLFDPYQARANSLTEEHDPFTRDTRIIRAVDPKNITLMTNSFGRGTDFVLLDDKIKQNGGLHVIQAFLSLDESEEVQIKGRTARQSGMGSYDCTLSDNWLEELDLKPEDIPKNATSDVIHSILLKARQTKIAKQAASTLNSLQVADKLHENTIDNIAKPKLEQASLITYVSSLNKFPEIKKTVIKTVLGLDATGSMSAALKRTCEIIGNAFTETYAVLKQKKVEAAIEIKIMVYRNYNSPKEQILESTTFENTPVNLKSFLERVGPKGGWGNQALQVLFQSLNKEKKIDQVILIGDAAPNTVSQVESKRNGTGGTNFWTANGFPPTHIDKQIAEFTSKKCPVHSFYLNNGTGFNEISAKTQGKAAPFKIDSPTVTKDLSAFVVINILQLIEKNSGNADLNLVDTYKKMFA